ncbi:hypothetical protein HRR83_007554 [Exophiala dermatitidis]|uniref:Uncharacterized protein n=1 Tax=Exophiala dermatitidis TaxID=5970 RepID=A0AAN6EQ47_EXODE|nr:hypothetical protein HRR75_006425 [Exophiala dermatitidis]KAJ4510528.1 hypothetical protein HRR74_007000 [Exophiala dermatitidis]KAJ4510539.1 hypothetical protein HRR73_006611 [Exophiala dermatitidis]KAJ4531563.1 hypothetical protein HRR77_009413 [Exophiala dermatitidis]KAJ4535145.1 hypothetical protein HRR76_007037 [Exophiala dermatitidis]
MPPRRKRLSSIQLPSKPAWLTIDLASCTVQYRDHPEAIQWSRDLKRKEAEGTPEKWYLQLSHDRANSGRMAMRVVGPDNQLIATVSFPDFDTSVDVYVYQETYRIEVRKHQKGTIKILEMYSFRLGVASDATTATKLFEQIRRGLSQSPLEYVRHTNVPRSLLASGHNLRATTRAHGQQGTRIVTWIIPGRPQKTVQFTGWVASAQFCRLWKWVTGEDANLAIIPANGAEQITDVVDDLPQATAAKNILPKDWGCCGHCKQGQTPSDITHIRTRRFRKEWIGCISGLECLSSSYWFHANATCAKISSGDMKKKGRLNWFCEICRTEGLRTRGNVRSNGFRGRDPR